MQSRYVLSLNPLNFYGNGVISGYSTFEHVSYRSPLLVAPSLFFCCFLLKPYLLLPHLVIVSADTSPVLSSQHIPLSPAHGVHSLDFGHVPPHTVYYLARIKE